MHRCLRTLLKGKRVTQVLWFVPCLKPLCFFFHSLKRNYNLRGTISVPKLRSFPRIIEKSRLRTLHFEVSIINFWPSAVTYVWAWTQISDFRFLESINAENSKWIFFKRDLSVWTWALFPESSSIKTTKLQELNRTGNLDEAKFKEREFGSSLQCRFAFNIRGRPRSILWSALVIFSRINVAVVSRNLASQ